jgi:hypothetical protein
VKILAGTEALLINYEMDEESEKGYSLGYVELVPLIDILIKVPFNKFEVMDTINFLLSQKLKQLPYIFLL